MNKLFTKITSLALGAAMMIGVGVSVGSKSVESAFADSKGITFSAAVGGNNVDKVSDGITWHISADGNESSYDGTKGIHYGTSSGQVTYIRISTSGISGTISKVVVNASVASGVSATVGVTVGGSQFGDNPKSLTTSASNYTFDGSSSGDILVEITKPSKAAKALYCKSVTVTYSASSHTHSWSDWSITPATCTEAGEKTRTCSTCDEVEVVSIPATGHDWGDWAQTVAPTCTSLGEETRVCNNDSSHTETRDVDMIPHNYVDGVCTVCGAEEPDETEFEYVFSDHYSGTVALDGQNIALDTNITALFNKREGGSNATQYYSNGTAVRWYGGGTLRISGGEGVTITEIVLTYLGGHANNVSADVGTFTESVSDGSGTGTWTGTSSAVLFTQAGTSGQDRIQKITVTYTGGTAPDPDTFTVTYNANGGTGDVPVDSKSYTSGDDEVTVLGNTGNLAKTGYTFNGWNSNNAGTGTHYTVGSTFTISANTTLFAEWSINHYTLSYDKQGGTGTVPAETSYDYGTKVTVDDGSNLSKTDYVFGGWSTEPAGAGTRYGIGSQITMNDNFILYAVWNEPGETYSLVENVADLAAGDEIVIASSGTGAKKALSTTQNNNNRGAVDITVSNNNQFEFVDGIQLITLENAGNGNWNFNVGNGYLYAASSSSNHLKTEESPDENGNADFSISISSGVASITAQGSNTNNQLKNNGSLFSCYASGQTSVSVYKVAEEPKVISSYRMTSGTVSAKNGDSDWTVTGFKFFVTYEGESETEVTQYTTFDVAESLPTITQSGSTLVHVTPSFKGTSYTGATAEISATLTFVDPYSIERLYDIELSSGATSSTTLTFDGVYMGYSTHVSSNVTYYDIYIGNGDYGMYVYGLSSISGWTAGTTKLTTTGYMKNFSGLYEFTRANSTNPSVSVLDDADRISHIITPTTYVVTGSQAESTNFKLASRKTSLSGEITSINEVTTAGTKATANQDNTILVSVGGNNVTLYLKKAQATSEVVNELSVGSTVTVSGFSSYHDGFQVYFIELVEAGNYHAADFAKDLLKLTREICSESDEGNGSDLAGVWLTLNSSDYWLKIKAAGEDSTFTDGTPDYDIEVPNTAAGIDAMSDSDAIAASIARYDWCTAKYKLTNFMERTLTVSFDRVVLNPLATIEGNPTAIIVIVSVIGVSALGGFFFLRKRKEI